MQYQWKWQLVDKPGVWAFGGHDKRRGPKPLEAGTEYGVYVEGNEGQYGQECWRCYLGPIPDIAPPEPELRLPEGWTAAVAKYPAGWRVNVSGRSSKGVEWTGMIELYHDDKPTAIRAAQAAVDELTKGTT